MIRTIRVRDTDKAIEAGWNVILIARSPGPLKRLIDDGRLEWIPQLAPSPALLAKVNAWKKNNSWNEKTFQDEYVPLFAQESAKIEFRVALNEIYKRSQRGEKIALTCFCGDETMCHKSFVLGLLQAVGCETLGRNYSPYWLYHRMAVCGTLNTARNAQKSD